MTKNRVEADMTADVRLLSAAFDAAAETAAFASAHATAGGIAGFLGQVRAGVNDFGDVDALELRHYAPLTLPAMQMLAAKANTRWELAGLLMLHRHGVMLPGEPIVLVAAAARHRRDAFAACEFVMDHLKSESWFWKREKAGGSWRWVEPREQDFADLQRWQ